MGGNHQGDLLLGGESRRGAQASTPCLRRGVRCNLNSCSRDSRHMEARHVRTSKLWTPEASQERQRRHSAQESSRPETEPHSQARKKHVSDEMNESMADGNGRAQGAHCRGAAAHLRLQQGHPTGGAREAPPKAPVLVAVRCLQHEHGVACDAHTGSDGNVPGGGRACPRGYMFPKAAENLLAACPEHLRTSGDPGELHSPQLPPKLPEN